MPIGIHPACVDASVIIELSPPHPVDVESARHRTGGA